MSTAFIIGAGCSAGTLGPDQCPVAGSFGAILENLGLGETYPQLGKVAEHLQVPLSKVGLEQIWTCIDYHVKFKGVFSINWSLENAVVELKTALLEIYGNPCNIAATGLSLTGEYTLSKIVNGIEPGDTVISFNYDTLLERLFLKRFRAPKFRHCLGAPPAGVVRFVKPHGSVSWNLHDLRREVTDGEPITAPLEKVSKGCIEPLVLGAVPLKSELITEVQCYYGSHRVFDVILRHWRAVADAIRDADRLVVLGYSFPSEDTYANFFYREAMRERGKQKPSLKIEYYELDKWKERTLCAIMRALPNAARPECKGPVTQAPR